MSLEKWYISGIDVTQLDMPYSTAGLPGEKFNYHLGEGEGWSPVKTKLKISPENQIKWIKTTFDFNLEDSLRFPLRLRIQGKHNAHIFLNGVYIGKYWGRYGPQYNFYLMDGLLFNKENVLTIACWTIEETDISLSIEPYKIEEESGNLNEQGKIFITKYKNKHN
ncbi:MAG: beta galactosidase jelly roll domain-containing protein [Candidatus Lokiarchaeota archaeon]